MSILIFCTLTQYTVQYTHLSTLNPLSVLMSHATENIITHVAHTLKPHHLLNQFSSLYPVKNVTLYIFSCLFAGSLVWFENDTESDENLIIFLANAMAIP